jgi:hypothetical protein
MTKSKSEEILARTVKIGKQKSPPPKKYPLLIKFDTAHIFIPPAIQREGGI